MFLLLDEARPRIRTKCDPPITTIAVLNCIPLSNHALPKPFLDTCSQLLSTHGVMTSSFSLALVRKFFACSCENSQARSHTLLHSRTRSQRERRTLCLSAHCSNTLLPDMFKAFASYCMWSGQEQVPTLHLNGRQAPKAWVAIARLSQLDSQLRQKFPKTQMLISVHK